VVSGHYHISPRQVGTPYEWRDPGERPGPPSEESFTPSGADGRREIAEYPRRRG